MFPSPSQWGLPLIFWYKNIWMCCYIALLLKKEKNWQWGSHSKFLFMIFTFGTAHPSCVHINNTVNRTYITSFRANKCTSHPLFHLSFNCLSEVWWEQLPHPILMGKNFNQKRSIILLMWINSSKVACLYQLKNKPSITGYFCQYPEWEWKSWKAGIEPILYILK